MESSALEMHIEDFWDAFGKNSASLFRTVFNTVKERVLPPTSCGQRRRWGGGLGVSHPSRHEDESKTEDARMFEASLQVAR